MMGADATNKWIETKGQVESVVDDARKINQVVARRNYGAEAARLWAALRTGINVDEHRGTQRKTP